MNLMMTLKMKNENNERKPLVQPASFSFFRAPSVELEPCMECMPGFIYRYLQSDYAKLRTMAIREEVKKGGGPIMWHLDEEFDRVTFAGVFRRKVEAELLRPSRFVCFHFRNIRFPEVEKVTLLSYFTRQTVLLFTDIYGTGLNWVTRNDTDMAHTDFFRTVERDMFREHGLDADDSGKLMSDAVYLPFDDEAYINPEYVKAEFDTPKEGHWTSLVEPLLKYDD